MYDFTVLGLRYVSVATSALLLPWVMRARISDSRSLRPSPRPGPIKSYGAVVPEVQFRRTLLGVFTCSAARTSRLGSVHADRPAYAPRLHPNADLSESP